MGKHAYWRFACVCIAAICLVAAAALASSAQVEYYDYFLAFGGEQRAGDSIVLTAEQAAGELRTIGGRTGVVISEENPALEWQFSVAQAGVYQMYVEYYPLPGSGRSIELSFSVDGVQPYTELGGLRFSRIWQDRRDENGVAILQDKQGNDIRPLQMEAPRWVGGWVENPLGIYAEPYMIYLEAGEHTFAATRIRESMVLHSITLRAYEAPAAYGEYAEANGIRPGDPGRLYVIQGEEAYEKSDASLAPQTDNGNAGMTPADPAHIRMNAIGAGTWHQNGQWISWQLPEDFVAGDYSIAFRVKQNNNPGLSSYRKLRINGEVPFAQAQSIAFPYDQEWYIRDFAQGEDAYLVRLQPGDVISLEVTTGAAGDILRIVNQTVLDMNALYRQMIVITGTAPDIYRDYHLEKEIPNLLSDLAGFRERAAEISAMLKTLTGTTSSQSSIMDQLVVLLDTLLAAPNLIPENIGAFKSGIDGMASLIYDFNAQPLQIDEFYIYSDGTELPAANVGASEAMAFAVQQFKASFTGDYSEISALDADESKGKAIKVWAVIGRDQAQVLSRLISDSFTPETGIQVELNLVSSETILTQSVLAGEGPDVALMLKMDAPINLALRGAVVNLAGGKYDLDALRGRFNGSAWTPFTYLDGVYAVPDSELFNVMYYRKDILEQLGLTPPDTWEEFYHVLKILQGMNLQVGINEVKNETPGVSQSIHIFDAFLFQNGGGYFNETMTGTRFDSQEALYAFEQWTNLYREYGLDKSIDFANRLRSGEMPLGIATLDAYAMISSIAPELIGLWDFAPIPGTPKADGTIDRSTSSSVTGSVMMQSAVEKGVDAEAFAFLNWWTSPDIQAAYSQEIEAMLGVAGRRFPASLEAFGRMGWSVAEEETILAQWAWVKGIPQIPATYYVNRSLSNAMRKATDIREEVRRTFAIYNNEMNDEILRKSREFDRNQ